jgi:hypothetical protein
LQPGPGEIDGLRHVFRGASGSADAGGVTRYTLRFIFWNEADVKIPETSNMPVSLKIESAFIMNTFGCSHGLGLNVSRKIKNRIKLTYKMDEDVTARATPVKAVHFVRSMSLIASVRGPAP